MEITGQNYNGLPYFIGGHKMRTGQDRTGKAVAKGLYFTYLGSQVSK